MRRLWKKLRGYKTLLFNAGCILAAVFYWATTFDWSQVSAEHATGIVVFVNIMNIILRFLTATPPMTGKD